MTRRPWGSALALGVAWGAMAGLSWPILVAIKASYAIPALVVLGLAAAMAVRESTQQRGTVAAAGVVATVVSLFLPWVDYRAACYLLPACLLTEILLVRVGSHTTAEIGLAGAVAVIGLLPAHIIVEARQLGVDLPGSFWLLMNQVGGALHLLGFGAVVVLVATAVLHGLVGLACGVAALRMAGAMGAGGSDGKA